MEKNWKEIAEERQVVIECLSQVVENLWTDCITKKDIKFSENSLNRLHDEISVYLSKMHEEQEGDVWEEDRSGIEKLFSQL